MNILLYVVTILMLLTLLGYARVESYRNSQLFYILFQNYMEKDERGYLNLAQDKIYEDTVATKKSPDKDKEKKTAQKPEGGSRINIRGLVDKTFRNLDRANWEQSKTILKHLMKDLYEDQTFYKEALHERPGFVDELLSTIENAADQLPKDKAIKKVKDLANLELDDPVLNNILYKMLHGAPEKYNEEESENKPLPQLPSLIDNEENKEEDTSQDDDILKEETKDPKSPEGYISLLDFITIRNSNKIRVYLAPKEVLQAIFQNGNVVNEILVDRAALFSKIMADADPTELKEVFKSSFNSRRDPDIGENTLDFTVTKTNPKYYN